MTARLLSFAVFAILLGDVASAVQQVKSLYTPIDFEKCEPMVRDGGMAGRVCEGLPEYPVFVASDSDKTFLSAGPHAAKTRAAAQSLGAENSIFDGRTRPTVEWRFVIRDERPVPYATIVRYFTRSSAGHGEVIVVSRVARGEACHVAYIDALANGEPMVLARKVADTQARQFDCASEPSVVGARGKSPM